LSSSSTNECNKTAPLSFRWYRAYLNHFTQPDTIIPDPGDPKSYNRYAYVNYNPLKYTDPTGHSCADVAGEEDCVDLTPEELLDIFYGVVAIGLLPDEILMALSAVRMVNSMLAKYHSSFVEAFGTNDNSITLVQTNKINIDGNGAYTNPDGTQIEFYSGTDFSVGLIIHEFGHVFDFRLGETPAQDWNTWNLEDDYPGWISRPAGFKQSPDENQGLYTYYFSDNLTAGEEFADMFLALTMDWWETDSREIRTDAAQARYQYMNTGMPFWLQGQHSPGP